MDYVSEALRSLHQQHQGSSSSVLRIHIEDTYSWPSACALIVAVTLLDPFTPPRLVCSTAANASFVEMVPRQSVTLYTSRSNLIDQAFIAALWAASWQQLSPSSPSPSATATATCLHILAPLLASAAANCSSTTTTATNTGSSSRSSLPYSSAFPQTLLPRGPPSSLHQLALFCTAASSSILALSQHAPLDTAASLVPMGPNAQGATARVVDLCQLQAALHRRAQTELQLHLLAHCGAHTDGLGGLLALSALGCREGSNGRADGVSGDGDGEGESKGSGGVADEERTGGEAKRRKLAAETDTDTDTDTGNDADTTTAACSQPAGSKLEGWPRLGSVPDIRELLSVLLFSWTGRVPTVGQVEAAAATAVRLGGAVRRELAVLTEGTGSAGEDGWASVLWQCWQEEREREKEAERAGVAADTQGPFALLRVALNLLLASPGLPELSPPLATSLQHTLLDGFVHACRRALLTGTDPSSPSCLSFDQARRADGAAAEALVALALLLRAAAVCDDGGSLARVLSEATDALALTSTPAPTGRLPSAPLPAASAASASDSGVTKAWPLLRGALGQSASAGGAVCELAALLPPLEAASLRHRIGILINT